jgi:hypothetical protein
LISDFPLELASHGKSGLTQIAIEYERDQNRQLRQDYAQTSEAAFNKVWDNDNDTIYDDP